MYIRVDISKTNGDSLFVMEQSNELNQLLKTVQLSCLQGEHKLIPNAIFIQYQQLTCFETNSKISTSIYKTATSQLDFTL